MGDEDREQRVVAAGGGGDSGREVGAQGRVLIAGEQDRGEVVGVDRQRRGDCPAPLT